MRPAALLPLLVAAWRARLVLAGLFAFCTVFLVGLELHYAPILGWSQHARYVMPVGVGIVLIAAALRAPLASRWVVALVAATAPVHLCVLAHVMTRYQSGPGARLNPFHGTWLPPGGPVVPLAAALAGLAFMVWLTLIGVPAQRPAGTRQPARETTTVGRSSPVDENDMAH